MSDPVPGAPGPARGPSEAGRTAVPAPDPGPSARRTAVPDPGLPAHEPPAPAYGSARTAGPRTAGQGTAGQGVTGPGIASGPRSGTDGPEAEDGPGAGDVSQDPVHRAAALARGMADAVRRCPDVVDLSGGPFGTVATYMPGEMMPGVALREDEVEVSIVVRLGRPLPEIAEEVRAAVASMAGDRPVNVHIGGVT
ncbi:hypothetical protein [Streptosporangium longisporum]|uniref:Asp23/Gls24 family envelope stress response protein n=1 Tax=Streptosporangium longisporum TaxID=46187 RepID=A0ABN3Y0N4_9ACTN